MSQQTIKRLSKAEIKRRYRLTDTDLQAIEHVGRHRKTTTYPHRKSCPVSVRTTNKLMKRGYIMTCGSGDDIKSGVMLTYPGERIFTALFPYSKWKIK
jgi:hypothetical protein